MTEIPASDVLHEAVTAVEEGLAGLGAALRERDTAAIDDHARALHAALADAVAAFAEAADEGRVAPSLRRRLASAGAQVAAHRESLARATASLDRAIDVLMPRDAAPRGYGRDGRPSRPGLGHVSA